MPLTDPSLYPKDLTMTLASNHIQNEIRNITKASDRIFVPNGGPFYSESLIIQTTAGRDLQPIVEYELLYLHENASLESNRNVVCVIRLKNETINAIKLSYRVIGGEYGNTAEAIKRELQLAGPIQNNVDWNVHVFNKPAEFPPAPHYHNASHFTDWDKIKLQMEGIRKAILYSDGASWESIFRYVDRKIDLKISNSAAAAIAEVTQGLNNYVLKTELASAYYTKEQINAQAVNFVTSQALSTQLNSYYNKQQVDAKFAGYYTKQEIDNRFNNLDVLRVSTDSGNLIEKRGNGLYYGIIAPPNRAQIFVDAVSGNDTTGDGSRTSPFKTLMKALQESPRNQSNKIYLKWIPDNLRTTHAYELVSNFYINTVTRTITSYGHEKIDGQTATQIRQAGNGVYNWYNNDEISKIPLIFRWHNSNVGTEQYKELSRLIIESGASIRLLGLELVVDALDDDAVPHIYLDRRSMLAGSSGGTFELFGCTFTRLYRRGTTPLEQPHIVAGETTSTLDNRYNTHYNYSTLIHGTRYSNFELLLFNFRRAWRESNRVNGVNYCGNTWYDPPPFDYLKQDNNSAPRKHQIVPPIMLSHGRISIFIDDDHWVMGGPGTGDGVTKRIGMSGPLFRDKIGIWDVPKENGVFKYFKGNFSPKVESNWDENYATSNFPVEYTTTNTAHDITEVIGFDNWVVDTHVNLNPHRDDVIIRLNSIGNSTHSQRINGRRYTFINRQNRRVIFRKNSNVNMTPVNDITLHKAGDWVTAIYRHQNKWDLITGSTSIPLPIEVDSNGNLVIKAPKVILKDPNNNNATMLELGDIFN